MFTRSLALLICLTIGNLLSFSTDILIFLFTFSSFFILHPHTFCVSHLIVQCFRSSQSSRHSSIHRSMWACYSQCEEKLYFNELISNYVFMRFFYYILFCRRCRFFIQHINELELESNGVSVKEKWNDNHIEYLLSDSPDRSASFLAFSPFVRTPFRDRVLFDRSCLWFQFV